MSRRRGWWANCPPYIAALFLSVAPVAAVQPDEVLDDPVLEGRARDISGGIRCLVCRNESIDESNADLARDLRLLIRERLVAGDSDAEVIDFLVDRYGEYVLLNPPATGSTLLLWGAPLALLLLGAGVAVAHIRGQRTAAPTDTLSEAEEARLRELTEGRGDG
ncbi:cytochrome c-type biogenesis protein [Jannaschia seohaensis]|uniref:Cytochrome c-type biogenesis protein n=1 Tax=Jannaschia seohaensis TaxID=475081 RepID=A0A2Y9AN25_9RHOB|nr:cytochrome c-type biogenesis protein [Jannaschia seohaensis]PWJ19137.1 cytochrome c-type biogenesis protein CcmH [Jannaschia seohaensis]SSA45790.1 cytochrome c-type biogenesis protein CcmH [Jannaschia seohaensis]